MVDEGSEGGSVGARGAHLIGRSAVVSIEYRDADGSGGETVQLHGRVIAVGDDVMTLEAPDGSQFDLPPAPEAFQPAEPGHYRLRPSGEVVVDPDLAAVWTVAAPGPDRR
ncbi:hypothetical protein PO878_13765 [Iamia majanohamensis]|uniref:Uncharacterized protein n=1 Tax=Iamia majanohamensis TaxID=467976 RepID=A0AAE9Y578_9ACTN|nr:hypothetical protein [Iamia majanohamensis]WCO65566.1 hypothetical protein PO878_13765 [Iamia majanohamensis]